MHRRFAYFSVVIFLSVACTTSPRYTRGGSGSISLGYYKNRSTLNNHKQNKQHKSYPKNMRMVGYASYYGPGFHGKLTASGERYNMYGLSAAHKTLPFGTRVRVHNLDNGKSVVVKINDRGPYKKHRILDLSVGAARKIGLIKSGVAKVRLEILK